MVTNISLGRVQKLWKKKLENYDLLNPKHIKRGTITESPMFW